LFEEGMVQNLDDMERMIIFHSTIQDYRGYPIYLQVNNYENFPLSDEILRMKNVQFYFRNQSKPNHKLVSPEPHFVEEERNLINNHFSYLGYKYLRQDIEEWECFEMDCEGHLVSMKSFHDNFQFSNESIEHLSNFPHLTNLALNAKYEGNMTNISLLSDLKNLSLGLEGNFQDPELLKDLGLFTNLLALRIHSYVGGFVENL